MEIGNGHAHCMSMILGSAGESIPVADGELRLGTVAAGALHRARPRARPPLARQGRRLLAAPARTASSTRPRYDRPHVPIYLLIPIILLLVAILCPRAGALPGAVPGRDYLRLDHRLLSKIRLHARSSSSGARSARSSSRTRSSRARCASSSGVGPNPDPQRAQQALSRSPRREARLRRLPRRRARAGRDARRRRTAEQRRQQQRMQGTPKPTGGGTPKKRRQAPPLRRRGAGRAR